MQLHASELVTSHASFKCPDFSFEYGEKSWIFKHSILNFNLFRLNVRLSSFSSFLFPAISFLTTPVFPHLYFSAWSTSLIFWTIYFKLHHSHCHKIWTWTQVKQLKSKHILLPTLKGTKHFTLRLSRKWAFLELTQTYQLLPKSKLQKLC